MNTAKKIVFVDDESDFHFISKLKFSREINNGEYVIHCFDLPLEALTFIEQNGDELDIVFTDLKMGKLDGFQLIEKIRQNFPSLPCFVISAFDSDRTRSRAEELKVYGYMQKPIDYEKIRKTIDGLSNRAEN